MRQCIIVKPGDKCDLHHADHVVFGALGKKNHQVTFEALNGPVDQSRALSTAVDHAAQMLEQQKNNQLTMQKCLTLADMQIASSIMLLACEEVNGVLNLMDVDDAIQMHIQSVIVKLKELANTRLVNTDMKPIAGANKSPAESSPFESFQQPKQCKQLGKDRRQALQLTKKLRNAKEALGKIRKNPTRKQQTREGYSRAADQEHATDKVLLLHKMMLQQGRELLVLSQMSCFVRLVTIFVPGSLKPNQP